MFDRKEIFGIIEQLQRKHTDKQGCFDLADIRRDLAPKMRAKAMDLDYESLAAGYIKDFDQQRRPQHQQRGFGFYVADAWIPHGDGTRVKMAHTTREQMLMWKSIERDQNDKALSAYVRKISYIDSRLKAWDGKCKTLADVEAKHFGDSEDKAA
jgi:hypothetical protein